MPGGPPPACDGSDVERDQFQIGIGTGILDTTLRFDDDLDVDLEMTTVSISGAWLRSPRWTIRAGAGLILDGTLQSATGPVHQLEPGGTVALGVEYRARSGAAGNPFMDLSLFLGASWAQTVAANSDQQKSYFAADARLGVRAGWTIGGNIFPYVAARIFGGPVNWELEGEDVVGTDIHHYQVALGTATQIGQVGVFVEWAGLGERALGAGMSTAW